MRWHRICLLTHTSAILRSGRTAGAALVAALRREASELPEGTQTATQALAQRLKPLADAALKECPRLSTVLVRAAWIFRVLRCLCSCADFCRCPTANSTALCALQEKHGFTETWTTVSRRGNRKAFADYESSKTLRALATDITKVHSLAKAATFKVTMDQQVSRGREEALARSQSEDAAVAHIVELKHSFDEMLQLV